MKNTFKILTSTLLAGLIILSVSCDQFTEEDALKAQQTVDLSIYVVDESSDVKKPVASATVTITQAGNKSEVVTDSSGVAIFPGIQIGGYVYNVTAENFITVNGSSSASPSNFRVGQITNKIGMYSTKDENMATIRGRIYIETDLTNLEKEGAASVPLQFSVGLNSGNRTYTTTTDAEGNYEIKVPTNGRFNSTYVTMLYEDLELDQKIAVNKFQDEDGDFPEVLPRIETVKTIFSTNTSGATNNNFGTNVRNVYAIADNAPEDGTTAIIRDVYINSEGEVTGVGFQNGGDYTGDADGVVNIKIISLVGGTGASIQINLGNQTNLSSAYSEFGTASRTLVPGSGYPERVNFENRSLNKISYRNPSFSTNIYVAPNSIKIVNGDYGTGIARPRQAQ